MKKKLKLCKPKFKRRLRRKQQLKKLGLQNDFNRRNKKLLEAKPSLVSKFLMRRRKKKRKFRNHQKMLKLNQVLTDQETSKWISIKSFKFQDSSKRRMTTRSDKKVIQIESHVLTVQKKLQRKSLRQRPKMQQLRSRLMKPSQLAENLLLWKRLTLLETSWMYNSRRQTMMILNKSFTWFLKTGLKTV
jgi:hypothetical protein